jgi:hypothetical protein
VNASYHITLRKHWYEVDGWLDGWLDLLSSGIQTGLIPPSRVFVFCSNVRFDLLHTCIHVLYNSSSNVIHGVGRRCWSSSDPDEAQHSAWIRALRLVVDHQPSQSAHIPMYRCNDRTVIKLPLQSLILVGNRIKSHARAGTILYTM